MTSVRERIKSLSAQHFSHLDDSRSQTARQGASLAQWRYETAVGVDAFCADDLEGALLRFYRAVEISDELALLAQAGRIDPDCAVDGQIAARRNVADVFLQLGLIEEAAAAMERVFLQLCVRAAWPCASPDLRVASAKRINEVSAEAGKLLKRIAGSQDRLASMQAIERHAFARAAMVEGGAI